MFTIHSLYIDEYELMGSINQKTFLKWSHFNYHFKAVTFQSISENCSEWI